VYTYLFGCTYTTIIMFIMQRSTFEGRSVVERRGGKLKVMYQAANRTPIL
jgi:hypothetical protein